MSNTRAHKPIQFVVPEIDIVYVWKNRFYIKNWKPEYNKHFSRIPAEKLLRKRLNKRERTILRDQLREIRYNPELFDDYTHPVKIDTLWYLE